MLRSSLALLSFSAAVACSCAAVAGEEPADFQAITRVYRAGEREPVDEVTTVFRKGLVYEFIRSKDGSRDAEATIYDPANGRFVILNAEREIWTEILTSDIEAFSAGLKATALGSKDPIVAFMGAPKFKEVEEPGGLTFVSKWMEYKVRATPAHTPDLVKRYVDCAQWNAQVNVMLTPGGLPPFPKMVILQALADRNLLPSEVRITLDPKQQGKRPISLRATHQFQWTLSDAERKRIDDTARQLAAYREVTRPEYVSPAEEEETAAAPAEPQR